MQISPEEKQAINQARTALMSYKKWIVLGLVLIVLPLIGYQLYQYQFNQKTMKASEEFSQLYLALQNEDVDGIISKADEIKSLDLGSPYGIQQQFLLANAWYQKGEREQTITLLENITKRSQSDGSVYFHLSNLQLIRLLLDDGKYVEAEMLLNSAPASRVHYELVYSYYQALIHKALDRNARAKETFAKVIELAQNNRQFADLARAEMALIP